MNSRDLTNGKSYEPERVKGSGLNVWVWRRTHRGAIGTRVWEERWHIDHLERKG